MRESAEESVLVLAARGSCTVELGVELPDDAELLEGTATWQAGSVSTDGPQFLAWRLPGIPLPAFEPVE